MLLTNFEFKGLIVIASLLLVPPLFADETPKPPKLFSENTEMQVTLTGPWRTIGNYIKRDRRYPAQLTYTTAGGDQRTLDIEVEPRGISRREWLCDFPPLKIYFNKATTKDTEFRGNGSLKMVTYCKTSSMYEQYYIKEYLAYRIYNLITDYSYRVRPLFVEYRDDKSKRGSVRRFGFLIEDTDDVAGRNGLIKLGITKISYKTLDPAETSKLGLFQFMIGNVDYATNEGPEEDKCCHNTKLIGRGDKMLPRYSIPYDFDATGLVDAHYAHPPPLLKMRNVRQRKYRGFCLANEEMPRTVALFKAKKTEILDLFKDDPHLDKHNRKKAIAYIESFYSIINDPKQYKRQITDACRGSTL